MPEKKTVAKAAKLKKEGRPATTQAGEFVREEMHHIHEGKHGAANPKQAIAIGLSKARRSGVDLDPPKKGKSSEATRKKAEQDLRAGKSARGAKKSGAKKSTRTVKKTGASAKKKSTARGK